MGQWQDTYVEARDDEVYVRGTRVTLESMVSFCLQGETPGELHEDFPSVSLAAVYGAVAFYLGHKAEVDTLLVEHKADYEARRAAAEAAEPERYAALRRRFAEIGPRPRVASR
jgi:uncharacterized protein (DUF433 family)